MKTTAKFLICILIGAVIGWCLGFLQFPYIEIDNSFVTGFITCSALALIVIMIVFVLNKNSFLPQPIAAKSEQQNLLPVRPIYIISILAFAILVCGLLVGFFIYRQTKFLESQLQNHNSEIQHETALIESVKKSNLVFLKNVLDNVEDELKNTDTLSDAIIARIAAVSFSFKPYRYLDGDSLSTKEYSPERGQLLLTLVHMKIDSASFTKIKHSTTFAGADLSGANLKKINLSGANLSGSNLKDADLTGSNLSNTNLQDANLWGAALNKSNLSNASLKRADLRWAQLHETNLCYANLNGAQISSAQLIKADARNASVQYADLSNAMLNDADFASVSFVGSGMKRINLNKADLTKADLRGVTMNESNLLDVELNSVLVDSNWVDKINDWRPSDVKKIRDRYSVITDTLDQFKHSIYRLKKIKN